MEVVILSDGNAVATHGAALVEAMLAVGERGAERAAALADENVRRFIQDKALRKVIVVPGKLVNIVI